MQLFVALKSSEGRVDVVADGGMIMHGYGAFMKSKLAGEDQGPQ